VGDLTFSNGFTSTMDATILVEVNGNMAVSEYDVIDISGDALVSGIIEVDLGFTPSLNDEFIILQSSGDLVCEDLPSIVNAEFEGEMYTFNVLCNADNITLSFNGVGVEEVSTQSTYSVYPNPFSSVATIKLNRNTLEENSNLVLRNSLGQVVREFEIDQGVNEFQIQKNELESGLYFFTLVTNEIDSYTEKLIIE